MDGTNGHKLAMGRRRVNHRRWRRGLHIVATPIGNMRDITLRALDVLHAADLIACEDTRVFAKLASTYGIAAPTVAYSDATQDIAEPRIVRALAAGKRVALVSDAGMPLISDPGYRLVRAAIAGGHAVTSAPGASAVPMALGAVGPADRSFLLRRLPAGQGRRAPPRHRRRGERAGHPGVLRSAAPACRCRSSILPIFWAAARRHRARTHQAVRGGAPWSAHRACRALCPASRCEGRDRRRDRTAGRGRGACRRTARRGAARGDGRRLGQGCGGGSGRALWPQAPRRLCPRARAQARGGS